MDSSTYIHYYTLTINTNASQFELHHSRMKAIILLNIIYFIKFSESNSFTNPYVLQDLFLKELTLIPLLNKANTELQSDFIIK